MEWNKNLCDLIFFQVSAKPVNFFEPKNNDKFQGQLFKAFKIELLRTFQNVQPHRNKSTSMSLQLKAATCKMKK